jgi:hypothetical protein
MASSHRAGEIAVGSVVYVQYVTDAGIGSGTWEERLVLARVGLEHRYIIATPDFEVLCEELSSHNVSLFGIRVGFVGGGVPVGIDRNQVYGFGQILKSDLDNLLKEGQLLASQLAPPFGSSSGQDILPDAASADVPVSIDSAVAPTLDRLAPAGGVWVIDEPTYNHEVGKEIVSLPAGAQVLGTRALVVIDGESTVVKLLAEGVKINDYVHARQAFLCVDRRIQFCPLLEDHQPVATLIREMKDIKGGLASPIEGTPVASWFLNQATEGTGASLVARHHRWRAESGVRGSLPCVYEHETLSQALDLGVRVDRLNLKNLVMVEFLLRRMQLHENAILENPDAPSYEGARFWMGMSERKGGALIAPSLQTHVASEFSKEAAILKEKRKAREARQNKGNGRGANATPPKT